MNELQQSRYYRLAWHLQFAKSQTMEDRWWNYWIDDAAQQIQSQLDHTYRTLGTPLHGQRHMIKSGATSPVLVEIQVHITTPRHTIQPSQRRIHRDRRLYLPTRLDTQLSWEYISCILTNCSKSINYVRIFLNY